MNICVYGAASNLIDKTFLDAGEQLGEIMAKRNHSLIFGGGAEGMMGAVARGVERNKGKTIGISPTFFKVDGVLFDRCSEFFYTKTMRERKQLLEEKSDAFLVSPGGIGTYDEFFEILSLRQLGRHQKPIVLFNINGYFLYVPFLFINLLVSLTLNAFTSYISLIFFALISSISSRSFL